MKITSMISVMFFLGLFVLSNISPGRADDICSTYDSCIERGTQHQDKGDIELAIKAFNEATNFDSNSSEAYYKCGYAYFLKKDYVNAEALFKKAIEMNPDNYHARLFLSQVYNETENHDKLIEKINMDIQKNPGDADLLAHRGEAYYFKGDYEKSIIDLKEAIRLSPDNHRLLYVIRKAYYAAGDYSNLFDVFIEMSQHISDDSAASAYFMYSTTFEKGDRNILIKKGTEAIQTSPQDSEAYIRRGLIYSWNKDYENAITDFSEAIRLDPDNDIAKKLRRYAYWDNKNYDILIEELNEIVKLKPNDVEKYKREISGIHVKKGDSFYEKKDYDNAINEYSEAIQLNPEDDWAYKSRGGAYYFKCSKIPYVSDCESMIKDYDKAISLRPDSAWYFISRGDAFVLIEDYESAIKDYIESARIDPNDVEAYIGRGKVYYEKGDYESAIEYFDKALSINLKNDWALIYRGDCYMKTKNYKKALEDYNGVIKQSPDNVAGEIARERRKELNELMNNDKK